MKRIIAIMTICLAPLAARAQSDVTFAQRLGTNHYYGTARTLGMGNAVTAVGGDLGSIGINPAGSAVFNYGQVELSPGLSILASGNSNMRMALPSAGFSLCFNTGRSSGLRNVSVAFVNNVSNNYLESFSTDALNNRTSFFANLAAAADGVPASILDGKSPYDSDIDWAIVSAYRAMMIGNLPDVEGKYAASNELLGGQPGNSYHYVPGDLRQQAGVSRTGTKNDMVLNVSFNMSDRLYFGFNLGIPIIRYRYTDVFSESAVDPEKFPIIFKKTDGGDFVTNFQTAKYGYSYSSTTAGVYGKAGILWRPLDFLRVGAAIQTPVAYGISEGYANSVTCQFSGKDGSIRGDASSPDGSYEYKFRGPWRFNTGVAFTLGEWGLLSADYEMAAYGKSRYSEKYLWNGDGYFNTSNEAIGLFLGKSQAARLGAELRPLPGFSLRAGATLDWSADRIWSDNFGKTVDVYEYYSDLRAFESGLRTLSNPRNRGDFGWSASFGAGWSSSGSFFVDAAVRYNSFSSYPYFPYLYGDYAAVDADNRPLPDASSPRFNVNRSLWDLVVTVGWRF